MNFFDNLIHVDVKKNMCIAGLSDELFCVYLYKLFEEKNKSILLVVNSLYEANTLFSTLNNYTDKVRLFPMDDFLTSEALAISPDLKINRLNTLNDLIYGERCIVITNLIGYLRFLPSKKTYEDFVLNLCVGEEISPKFFVEKLIKSNYSRTTLVTRTGEIGVRGFVIDVFPINEEYPVRIEFFGDEIDSIRYFDVNTQKTIEKINKISINPFSEFLTYNDVTEEHFGKQKYLPTYEDVVSISEYFNSGYVFYKDYEQLKTSYLHMLDEINTYNNERDVKFKGNYMFSLDDIKVSYPVYYMSINNITNSDLDVLKYDVKTINNFAEDIDHINSFIRENIASGKTVLICLKKYQLKSISKKLNMNYVEATLDNIALNKVNLIEKEFNHGYIFNDFVLLTANELFINNERKRKYNTTFKYSSSISDISKLNIGDYVVHSVHGIGMYNGIKTLSSFGYEKDYLEVLYQGTDKIYIPVEKIDLLTKYSTKDGVLPKVNKLGGTEWEKTKARVRSKVKDMADKLLKLYAERESKKGFAFSPDCDMLHDFENDFPYELTKDQITAIQQIKADMEKSVPMDRLLCGDVGFGKTEVAFVAAFKAILDSKQVLFLCPTTILSNQHYENAKERFKNFPVSIALLNRFTPAKEVNNIIEGLKSGTIDLVFGTHRLLSDDVKPKDLGLLIIDEEQRFGVLHKEKIKEYKTNVDVLTLSATPIPRTLQMSLVGIRSLSLIETPPVNRYPVQTYVIQENMQILKDAIYKELSRNGQVYILYNKVQSINEEALKIQKLVPEASIAVVHGQMTKNELEGKIFDFVNKKYDVLVCTTIIETGIDIPNVNTLIIIDADRFGLSQLYQIRGRVGRSDRFAYAYLMYDERKILTEQAIKRLNVIKEFTELGSGFSIAARDLSIRGAGDILGSEQAGFIDSVGIDLYLKMLNEEVSSRNETAVEEAEEVDTKPLINVSTHIDDSYVSDDDLKIEIHRKINEVDSLEKFNAIKLELEDRFGKINEDISIYMYEEWFEKLAQKLNIKNVHQNKNSIEIVLSEELISKVSVDDIFMDAFYISNMFRFISKGTNLIIVLDIIKLEKHPIYYLVSLLDKIYSRYKNSID